MEGRGRMRNNVVQPAQNEMLGMTVSLFMGLTAPPRFTRNEIVPAMETPWRKSFLMANQLRARGQGW